MTGQNSSNDCWKPKFNIFKQSMCICPVIINTSTGPKRDSEFVS